MKKTLKYSGRIFTHRSPEQKETIKKQLEKSTSTGGAYEQEDGATNRSNPEVLYQLHGHPRFYDILDELAELHSKKNYDYASGGDPLGNFKRVAKILSLYPNLNHNDPTVVAITYALKQLDAVLWILSNKHKPEVEGIVDRLRDVAVYFIIAMILEETKKFSSTIVPATSPHPTSAPFEPATPFLYEE